MLTTRRRPWNPLLLIFSYLLLNSAVLAQMPSDQILSKATQALPAAVAELLEVLALPNNGLVASERAQNLAWGLKTFTGLGYETDILVSNKVQHLFAQSPQQTALKTILFYLQMDGQPVDTSKWQQQNPYTPVIKELRDGKWHIVEADLNGAINPDWRIFARSASDSKGPAMAFITALRILQQTQTRPAFNIKVIMDFQEELGSPALPDLVRNNRAAFAADLMLIMDGTRHPSNLPTLTFGARGMATVSLTVYGARDNLHSGQYGNFAPNPVFGLARLLAGMKDEQGRVLIPGYYDGVLISDADKRSLANMPEDTDAMLSTLGIAEAEHVGANYAESLQYPSLNVRGLRSAWVGDEVRTLLPAEAIAEIDMRLVAETPAERMIELLKTYVKDQGYHIVSEEPTDEERMRYAKLVRLSSRIGSRPFRTELDSPIGVWLSSTMHHLFGDNYVKMRSTGGSQPIAPFITALNVPAVSIRIPNPDNSIHAPNENLRIGNYLEGIQMCLGILTSPLSGNQRS